MDPSGSRAWRRTSYLEEDSDDGLVYGDEYFDDYYERQSNTRTRELEITKTRTDIHGTRKQTKTCHPGFSAS